METIYIYLEKPPRGMNHARTVQGRAAANNWTKLNAFARELKARPLNDFLGNDTDAGTWFPPKEALATLQRLITRIASDRQAVDNVRHLIRDLNSYENILSAAQARGSKFHFSTRKEKPVVE
ncbi:MAG: hypothetical protein WC859_03240 [Elusimicrobiota bacterium]|jgi:hypothetical protein